MNAKQKAMVLAVGAALAAPCAHAQIKSKANSDWEFYGKFYPELTHQSGKGATPAGTAVSNFTPAPTGNSAIISRWEMQVNNTYIGFRGDKDLGGGLKGIWQLESAVAIDNANGDPLGNRNTFVGLNGGFGTVRLGNMDTPFKEAGDELSFLGIASGNFVSTSNVMRKISLNNSSSASFHLRRGNAVDYTSPEFFGGLTYRAQYSVGNPDEATTITRDRKPSVVSMSVVWEKGSWYFAAANEVHFDLFGGSGNSGAGGSSSSAADAQVHSKDTATQLTAQYKMGAHAFELDYNIKNYKETPEDSATPTAGRFVEYKNTAVQLVWTARWGKQWRTAMHYLKASAGDCTLFNASCSTTGLEGTQISAGVSYYLDPNFYLFALYSVLRNGDSARFENLEASGGSARPAPGEDITQGAVGVTYTF